MSLTVGLVGAGGIGETHAENVNGHGDATLAAVCDLDAERADALAGAVDAATYTDHRSLFREVDLDAVYVTTPPQTRVEIVRDAAREGAAVFCEKPLAATLEDAREIRGIVEKHDVLFMVGFCSRFWEPCQRLYDLVDDGEIGDPVTVFSERAGYGVPEEGNWRTDPEQACGITVESASHNIDVLRWLGGDVASASGQTANVTHPELERFDDNMVATVGFENGAIGLIQNSWTAHTEHLRHGVIGTEGAAVVEGDGWWRLDRLTYAAATDEYPTTITFDSETATDGGYAGETDAFLNSVADGTNPPVDVYDGLAALEVSCAVLGET